MHKQLILAPTIHRAKQIEAEFNNPLSQSLTLDNFIKAMYARYGSRRVVDALEAKHILIGQLLHVKRDYFDYLSIESDALNEILAFFISLKRNAKTVADFSYPLAKEQELESLLQKYNAFLHQHSLYDSADVELEVLKLIENKPESTKYFGEIILDSFDANGIHYESSSVQKKILETLEKNDARSYKRDVQVLQVPKFYEASPKPFHQIDEVASALKIARSLLDKGEDVDDIIIVTSAIDEYAPIFESQLAHYGLKGYSSKGTPLRHYLPLIKTLSEVCEDELLIQAYNTYENIKKRTFHLHKQMQGMGIRIDFETLLEEAIEQIRIKSRTFEGILLTEPNQVMTKAKIKHLIFMGTDMGHFPPQSKESFLVTQKQSISLLHANSVYLSSQNHYLHMKNIAEHLYIITATYKDKTKLARSMMITELCEAYDISDYQAQHELLRDNRCIENPEITPYLKSMQSHELSAYEGKNVGTFKVTSLSASQLNSYAMCPRRYFMSKILGLQAPRESQEGFEASDKGTIMHRCFELFAMDVKAGKLSLGRSVTQILQQAMRAISEIAYKEYIAGDKRREAIEENVHHRLFLQELQKGLDGETDGEGLLQRFLYYVVENAENLDHFKSSEFELEFRLDKDYKVISNDKSHYFIKGFIDRVDVLEDEIKIVDYKSKKMDTKIDKKKLEQMRELKDMQLALYILFAKRHFGDKKIESYLQSFKTKYLHVEFAKTATYEVGKENEYVHYDDDFEKRLIAKIGEIEASIESGDFHYDDGDEEHCKWCEFALMCEK